MASFDLIKLADLEDVTAGNSNVNFSGSPGAGKRWMLKEFFASMYKLTGGGSSLGIITIDIDGKNLFSPLLAIVAANTVATLNMIGHGQDGPRFALSLVTAGGQESLPNLDNFIIDESETLTVDVDIATGGAGDRIARLLISALEITL